MSGIFKFKQFDVDQSGCAMKINTDGVLLGALADADHPRTILDIGTGTGVIALMLAQRFRDAKVDAVEIDQSAAETASRNFSKSPFAERMSLHAMGFEQLFESNPNKRYDLIVSNPPFYINSLKSPEVKRELAKHTDTDFFAKLVSAASSHLNSNGLLCLILPIDTAMLIEQLTAKARLYLHETIQISSFENLEAHRLIMCFGFKPSPVKANQFVIYKSVGNYSEEYINSLRPYFIAF